MSTTNKQKAVPSFAFEAAAVMKAARQAQTAKGYLTLAKHLQAFCNRRCPEHLPLAGFDTWRQGELIDFKAYLLTQGCGNNTIQLYLHRLHALHCRAAEQQQAQKPGKLYHCVFEQADPTYHQPLSAHSLRLIRDAQFTPTQTSLGLAAGLFMLSYYLCGIPFVDLAHLRHSDIRHDRLYYRRSKTGRQLVVVLTDQMRALINRLRNAPGESPYLFPLIKHPGRGDEERQYESALRCYNKRLKRIGQLLCLDENLSSYTPRYTWASTALERGVPLSYVSASLGHASEKTTRHYVAVFKPELLAVANAWVLGAMEGCEFGKEKKKGKAVKSFLQELVEGVGRVGEVPVFL